jgi:hypothetical protein
VITGGGVGVGEGRGDNRNVPTPWGSSLMCRQNSHHLRGVQQCVACYFLLPMLDRYLAFIWGGGGMTGCSHRCNGTLHTSQNGTLSTCKGQAPAPMGSSMREA